MYVRAQTVDSSSLIPGAAFGGSMADAPSITVQPREPVSGIASMARGEGGISGGIKSAPEGGWAPPPEYGGGGDRRGTTIDPFKEFTQSDKNAE